MYKRGTMNTARRRATAALWSIQGVGPVTLNQVETRAGPVETLFDRPLSSWVRGISWRGDAAEHLAQIESLEARADWLENTLARQQVEIAFRGDPKWPARLEGIPKEPPLLFLRGPGADAPLRRRLAIVGTRHPELGAVERLMEFAMSLGRQGIGVVSGAAYGVDRGAHLGALNGEGETWAFLGSSIDQLDSGHYEVVSAILKGGGTIFSEYPPGFRANQSSFTQRNRLISGASDATLVFRAPHKSGALYTARFALEQNRPLLASPGDPWNAAAAGTNQLIRDGKAFPLTDSRDVLRALGLADALSPTAPVVVNLGGLSTVARQVFDALSGCQDFESLTERCPGVSSAALSSALVELEVSGAVIHRGGRRYEKR